MDAESFSDSDKARQVGPSETLGRMIMRAVIVHPRMSAVAGGERVAIHMIRTLLRSGNDVALISEKFDTKVFESFFGCEGLLRRPVIAILDIDRHFHFRATI